MSRWHTNKPWSSLPKDHPFTAYCTSKCTSTKFVRIYIRSYACHSPLSYLWTVLVRARALIPWWGFTLIYQHRSANLTQNQYRTSSTVHSGNNSLIHVLLELCTVMVWILQHHNLIFEIFHCLQYIVANPKYYLPFPTNMLQISPASILLHPYPTFRCDRVYDVQPWSR